MLIVKKFSTRPKDILLTSLVLALVVVLAGSRCKDPEEYDPTEPLDPPPAPPTLIFPLPDTVLTSSSSIHDVLFDWNTVAGAEIYQIYVDTNLTFSDPMVFLFSGPPTYIVLRRYARSTAYYTRIRAGSSRWTNYTDWSESRRFFLLTDL